MYRGYTITECYNGFNVYYRGQEILFYTLDGAYEFIDSLYED